MKYDKERSKTPYNITNNKKTWFELLSSIYSFIIPRVINIQKIPSVQVPNANNA